MPHGASQRVATDQLYEPLGTSGNHVLAGLATTGIVAASRNQESDMAEAGWVRVASVSDVAEGQVHAVRVGDREIAVYHLAGGDFRATDNICTHEYAMLSDGWLEDGCIECPLHAARFDVKTGKALCAPAETESSGVRGQGGGRGPAGEGVGARRTIIVPLGRNGHIRWMKHTSKPANGGLSDLTDPRSVAEFRKAAQRFTAASSKTRAAARQTLAAEGIYTKAGRLTKHYA